MHARARRQCADRHLAVGHIEMQFVAAPILFVALAVLLGTGVALPRQFREHLRPFLPALALDARATLGCFLFLEGSFRAFLLVLLVLRGLRFPLLDCLRVMFARHNRRGITRDMSDQAFLLRSRNHSFVQLLWQFARREPSEGPREFRFVGQRLDRPPAAEFTQGSIYLQARYQVARGG